MISPVQLRDSISTAARTTDAAEIERLSGIVAGMIDLDEATVADLRLAVSQVVKP